MCSLLFCLAAHEDLVYFGGERRAALTVDTHWHKRFKGKDYGRDEEKKQMEMGSSACFGDRSGCFIRGDYRFVPGEQGLWK